MLVQVNETKCVNTNEMQQVVRNGNYTVITLNNGTMMQIWDEHHALWSRIINAINRGDK